MKKNYSIYVPIFFKDNNIYLRNRITELSKYVQSDLPCCQVCCFHSFPDALKEFNKLKTYFDFGMIVNLKSPRYKDVISYTEKQYSGQFSNISSPIIPHYPISFNQETIAISHINKKALMFAHKQKNKSKKFVCMSQINNNQPLKTFFNTEKQIKSSLIKQLSNNENFKPLLSNLHISQLNELLFLKKNAVRCINSDGTDLKEGEIYYPTKTADNLYNIFNENYIKNRFQSLEISELLSIVS